MTNITHTTEKIKGYRVNPASVLPSPNGDVRGLGGPERSEGLPSCLYSNNSIENPQTTEKSLTETTAALTTVLSPYHKKQAQTLFLNVERLLKVEAESTNHVGFLTLTFAENITDHKEAYRRFRSFNTNYLSKHPIFGEWVNTKERQKRGAWHYHLVIALTEDIKTGFDFDKYDEWLQGPRKLNTFPTGNKALHSLWADLRENLEKYGLGKIFSLEPVRSNAEAMARYIGKYISKHLGNRSKDDTGVRLVNYSRNWIKNSVRCSWHNDNAKLWREKLRLFAYTQGCSDFYQLAEKLGPNWAYKYQEDIVNIYKHITDFPQNIKEPETYTPPLLKSLPLNKARNKAQKEAKMLKDLTMHCETSAETQKKLFERQKFKDSIPTLVKDWINSDEYQISLAAEHKKEKLNIDYKTGEIIKPSIEKGVPF